MRNLIWVFSALVVVSGVISTNLWRELRTERVVSASLRTQLDEGEQLKVAMPPAPIAALAPPAAAPLPAAATTADQPPPAAKVAPAFDAAASLRDYENEQRELLKDPEYRKARLAQIRTSVARNNMGMAEELGLSQAEADKLLDLLAEQQMDMSGNFALLGADQKDPAAMQESMRKQQESLRQRDEAIAALLGPSKNAQWRQYQQNAPVRSRVTSMNNTLSQAGLGLNAGQQKSLQGVLAAQMQNQNQEFAALARGVDTRTAAGRAQVEDALRNRQAESNRRVLADAQSILNEQQLVVLRAQLEQQEALNRAMARARERAGDVQAPQGGP